MTTVVVVSVVIAAPPARVWRALTRPEEVQAWDGAVPLEVPVDYPQPGQHARWRARLGPLPLTLHDRVVAVEPLVRLAASIDHGFVHVDEEYRLSAAPGGGTRLVSDNLVRARLPGLGRLADRAVAAGVRAAMARLSAHCALDKRTETT